MNQLPQELLEEISNIADARAGLIHDRASQKISSIMECTEWGNRSHNYAQGIVFALTDPSIYTKAGLIKPQDQLLAILVQKYPNYDIKEANPDTSNKLLQAIGMCWKAVDLSKLTDEEIDFIHKIVKLAS